MTITLEDKYIVWIAGGAGIVGFLAYMKYSTVKSERDRLVAAGNAVKMKQQMSQLVEEAYHRAFEDARAASPGIASRPEQSYEGNILEMPARRAEGLR